MIGRFRRRPDSPLQDEFMLPSPSYPKAAVYDHYML